jgi:di/tricarboxylate transporter
MKFIKTLLLFFILSSCFKDDVKKVEIEVYRFDKELSSVDSTNIDAKIDKWDTILNGFHHFYYSSPG